MKKIITILQPFTLNQQVLVYEDNNKIDIAQTTIDNINNIILDFVNKYNITQIEFLGPTAFSTQLGQKLLEDELTKYGKNVLEIKYSQK